MPDSPSTRLRKPNRPRNPHAGESFEPVGRHKGGRPSAGVFVLVLAGFLAFSYAFNLGGMQPVVDGMFSGLNASARSHNDEVAAWFPKVLPYFAFGAGGILILIMIVILARMAETLSSPGKKKKRPTPQQKPVEKPTEQQSEAPRPAQEFIRPARLAIREQDLKPKASPPANDPPTAN